MSDTDPPCRVLLVDDEPTIRSLLRLMLHRTGRYEVVGEAGDGEHGLRLAAAVAPDLVLLDLSMPRMDGLEALSHLRVLVPHANLVVLSGFASTEAAQAARQAGAHAYLEKGLAPTAIIEQLDATRAHQPSAARP